MYLGGVSPPVKAAHNPYKWPNVKFLMRIILLSLMIVLVSACIAQQEERGYMRNNAEFDRVIPGTSTNKDVLELLGSPSSYSSFGDETWYYISTRRETAAFLKPEIVDQNAVAVEFDSKGVVKQVRKFTEKDQRDIAISTEKTPTEGNHITIWQQLLGNLGRFNTEGGSMPGQHGGTGGAASPNR